MTAPVTQGSHQPKGAGASAHLTQGLNLLQKARFFARISACFFILAAFGVVDALQEMMRHDFNHIDILPGESFDITGMYPAGISEFKDIKVRIEGAEGLSFSFTESYKGFWLGGQMWRGNLTANTQMQPGKATLTIVDTLPARQEENSKPQRVGGVNPVSTPGIQNPTLVHTITVWETPAAMQASKYSYSRRYLGMAPFTAAGLALGAALAGGLGHFLVFRKAEKELAARMVFFIHGTKPSGTGTLAIFSLAGQVAQIGTPTVLRTVEWQHMGTGSLTELTKGKGYALFTSTAPNYGWLVECSADSKTKDDSSVF